jgi:hypothetical protein
MKTKLLFTVFCSIIVLTVSAQDTLKVNFKPAGTTGEIGWDSILVSDKTAYEAGFLDFVVFNSTVSVNLVWKNSPIAENVRAVDRNKPEFQYTGPLANVLRSYIAVDARYENDCNILTIQITGLPEGTYTFESYHHDYEDQYGSFLIATRINGDIKDADFIGKMISHSMDLETFEERYAVELDSTVAIEFQNHYVTNSLDSVTKYTFNQIVSSGASDVIELSFQNILAPAPDMNHSLKFTLINGFKLYKSPATSIENIMLNSLSVYPNPASEILQIDFQSGIESEVFISIIDITGKTVLKNTSELSNMDKHLEIDISNLPKGIYVLRLSVKGDQVVRKFEIR